MEEQVRKQLKELGTERDKISNQMVSIFERVKKMTEDSPEKQEEKQQLIEQYTKLKNDLEAKEKEIRMINLTVHKIECVHWNMFFLSSNYPGVNAEYYFKHRQLCEQLLSNGIMESKLISTLSNIYKNMLHFSTKKRIRNIGKSLQKILNEATTATHQPSQSNIDEKKEKRKLKRMIEAVLFDIGGMIHILGLFYDHEEDFLRDKVTNEIQLLLFYEDNLDINRVLRTLPKTYKPTIKTTLNATQDKIIRELNEKLKNYPEYAPLIKLFYEDHITIHDHYYKEITKKIYNFNRLFILDKLDKQQLEELLNKLKNLKIYLEKYLLKAVSIIIEKLNTIISNSLIEIFQVPSIIERFQVWKTLLKLDEKVKNVGSQKRKKKKSKKLNKKKPIINTKKKAIIKTNKDTSNISEKIRKKKKTIRAIRQEGGALSTCRSLRRSLRRLPRRLLRRLPRRLLRRLPPRPISRLLPISSPSPYHYDYPLPLPNNFEIIKKEMIQIVETNINSLNDKVNLIEVDMLVAVMMGIAKIIVNNTVKETELEEAEEVAELKKEEAAAASKAAEEEAAKNAENAADSDVPYFFKNTQSAIAYTDTAALTSAAVDTAAVDAAAISTPAILTALALSMRPYPFQTISIR